MAIYTKKGDKGLTSLPNAGAISKGQPVFELLGNLDELNCQISITLSHIDEQNQEIELLKNIQSGLMHCGALISQNPPPEFSLDYLKQLTVTMEGKIDQWESLLPKLTNFIIPSGPPSSRHLHLCRAITRRCERSLNRCYLGERHDVLSPFLNRLSDCFFQLARHCGAKENYQDQIWMSNQK